MRVKPYSDNARLCLDHANKVAYLTGTIIESVHLILGILNTSTKSKDILTKYGLNINTLSSFTAYNKTSVGSSTVYSPVVRSILNQADQISDTIVKTEDILLSIASTNCIGKNILTSFGLSYDIIARNLSAYDRKNNDDTLIILPERKLIKTDDSYSMQESINWGEDLCETEHNNENQVFVSRENELIRIERAFIKKENNNVLLIGESGVGKTTLVRILASKIVSGKVSTYLLNRKIISIDIHKLFSEERKNGYSEKKINILFSNAQKYEWILLFDDVTISNYEEENVLIEQIMQYGKNKHNIPIICTMSNKSYRVFSLHYPYLLKFYTIIDIKEPTNEVTIGIINETIKAYELYYSITIDKKIADCIVRTANRLFTNRYFPKKAIELLDEACSSCKTSGKKLLTAEDILQTAKEISSVASGSFDDAKSLILINKQLNERIIGQESAINTIYRALLRAKSGLHTTNKPIGSFIFIGSTGVGKTQTAKTLAELLFGSEKYLIRLDMSEYMEKNAANKLIGSPPGYIGYEEGGILTESVKEYPYSVILFDEIEKANKEVFDLLLQVLDEGFLTDSRGVKVSFINTILIMTSNLGSQEANQTLIGFGNKEQNETKHYHNSLSSFFRPEFLNRIDEVIMFQNISKENARKISNNILKEKIRKLIDKKNIYLDIDKNVVEFILQKSYDRQLGVRPIQRAIEKYIDDRLSVMIIQDNIKNAEVSIRIHNEELIFSVQPKEVLI